MNALANEFVERLRSVIGNPDEGRPFGLHEPEIDELEKQYLNECLDSTFVSSVGAFIGALSMLIFFYTVIEAFLRKREAGANPWGPGATTLEWTLPSPPPFHQFEVLPRISGPGHQ